MFLSISRSPLGSAITDSIRKLVQVPISWNLLNQESYWYKQLQNRHNLSVSVSNSFDKKKLVFIIAGTEDRRRRYYFTIVYNFNMPISSVLVSVSQDSVFTYENQQQ